MGVKTEKLEFDPEDLAVLAENEKFMYYFKILVRTLTLHQCVIPTVNPDVSIFINKTYIAVFVFIHEDNHFVQKYSTKQCCSDFVTCASCIFCA